MRSVPGLGLCIAFGVVAETLSRFVPFGSVAVAILLGVAVGNTLKPDKIFTSGISFCEKRILALALMGVNLNFMILKDLGYQSILIIVTAMAVTISSSLSLRRYLNLTENSRFK